MEINDYRRQFYVNTTPRGQGRPRFTVINGHPVAYKSKEDKAYEQKIRDAYIKEYGNEEPFKGTLHVMVRAYFPIPMSYTKKRIDEIEKGKRGYAVKPDIDNVLKSVLDALNKVAWEDDSKVTSVYCEKEYDLDDEPHIEVTITNIEVLDRSGQNH